MASSNEEDRALPGVSIINILLGAVSFIVVSLRIYTRVWIKPSAGWDDLLIVLGLVFGITYTVGQLVQVYDGNYGHHKTYLTLDDWILIWKWNAVVNTILPVSVFCSRASICIFLLRLLKSIRRWRCCIYVALCLNATVCIGTVIMYAIECVPISREWNDKETRGFCVDRKAFDIVVKFFSSLNCVVDFMCAMIPFVAMQTVRLDRRTRLGLYLILCCGVLTAACSIGRAVSLDFKNPDPTYYLVPLSYWTAAEMYGAIIFASLPALRQLLSLMRRKLATETDSPQWFWQRRRRSRPHSEPTMWTYSPDSGGFGSFIGSARRTWASRRATERGTNASTRISGTNMTTHGVVSMAPVTEEDREIQAPPVHKTSTVDKPCDSFFELSSQEQGDSSGRTTRGSDNVQPPAHEDSV